MAIDLGSMSPQNRPPAVSGPTGGSVSLEAGTSEASAGSKPVTSRPTSELGADTSKSIAQGGQSFSQGIGKQAVGPVPTPVGDMTNQSKGPGTASGFPSSGDGSGTGLVAKPGVIGQTKAKARPMTGGFLGSK